MGLGQQFNNLALKENWKQNNASTARQSYLHNPCPSVIHPYIPKWSDIQNLVLIRQAFETDIASHSIIITTYTKILNYYLFTN